MAKKIPSKIIQEWSILCSNSLVDVDSNNLSLFNIIEQINLNIELKSDKKFDEKAGDIFPLNMVLVSRFRKTIPEDEPIEVDVKIDFVSPDKELLGSFSQSFELGSGIDNIRLRSGIQGLKLTKSGMYNFVIFLKEQSEEKFDAVYSLPLKVTLNVK